MPEYEKNIDIFIPPNFSLNNYDYSTSCNPCNWFSNIKKRESIHHHLHNIDSPEGNLDIESLLSLNLENIKIGFSNESLTHNSFLKQGQIKTLTSTEIQAVHAYIEKDINSGNRDHVTDFDNFYKRQGKGIAKIDLTMPNDILIEQFKVWIEDSREKNGINKKINIITDSTFRRWHFNKVIPYIDLIQWNALNSRLINHHQAATIIFPRDNSRDTTDVIRKTTKVLMEKLFSLEVIEALRFQCHKQSRKINK